MLIFSCLIAMTVCQQVETPIGCDDHPLIIEAGQPSPTHWKGIRSVAFESGWDDHSSRAILLRDRDVEVIRGRAQITSVSFAESSQITDKVVDVLKTLPQLEKVGFYRVNLTDHGLTKLASIGTLKEIEIESCPISDVGLSKLGKLSHLETLSVRQCPVFGTCVTALADIKSLRHLDLSETNVDDGIAQHISKLQQLRKLTLSYTAVTSRVLGAVAKLRNLRWLNIWSTDISAESIVAFRRRRSDVKVHTCEFAAMNDD